MAVDDPDFTIIAQSDAHAKATLPSGHKKPLGIPVLTAYPDTSDAYLKTGRSELLESFRKVIKTGELDIMPVLRYDIQNDTGQFTERYWRITHYPVLENGSVKAVLQLNEEVTDEIVASKELVRTAMQLDNALAVANIGTWQWHVPTNHVTADKHLASMFGVSQKIAAEGLPLDTFINSIYVEDRKRVMGAIDHTVENCSSFEEEYRTVSTDGSVRWVLARGQVEADTNGHALNFPGVIIDITENKQASINASFFAKVSRELVGSANYKKALGSIAKMAVPEIADWCSIDMITADGELDQVAVQHKDPKKVAWAIEYREKRGMSDENGMSMQVIRSGEPIYIPEITKDMIVNQATSKEEEKLALDLEISSVIVVPLIIQAEAVGVLTFILTGNKRLYTEADFIFAKEVAERASLAMTNITLLDRANTELQKREALQTELKRANEELENRVRERTMELSETNTNLKRTNQELEDFAYVASHDLQEPLRKIQAFGDILEDEYGSVLGDGKDYLNRMRKAAARMSTLIEDLLSFSRVTTHAKNFNKVDLNQLLVGVLEDLETRISDTGGSVQSDRLPTIEADNTQMRQLFQNLIGNALKFHKPGVPPEVIISAASSENMVTLRFTDNGIGFDEKYADKVFAVFQRLHSRENYEGTGIGLAVCRKIVERHGGTITANSTPGSGATFIVTLRTKA